MSLAMRQLSLSTSLSPYGQTGSALGARSFE